MTFKAILEGTLRSDAETWVRRLMNYECIRVRNIEAETISYIGKNEQALVSVEIWYNQFDQAGIKVLFNLDAYGIHPASIMDEKKTKYIWFLDHETREHYGIDRFQLTRREF